jgi:hypothetical protein
MTRLAYRVVSPDAYRALLAVESRVRHSGLGNALLDLVYLRVSQLGAYFASMPTPAIYEGPARQRTASRSCRCGVTHPCSRNENAPLWAGPRR